MGDIACHERLHQHDNQRIFFWLFVLAVSCQRVISLINSQWFVIITNSDFLLSFGVSLTCFDRHSLSSVIINSLFRSHLRMMAV